MRSPMPSTITAPGTFPLAISSRTMAPMASAAWLGEVVGGAAAAGVAGAVQATATWQIRPTRKIRNASAGRLGLALRGLGLDLIGRVDIAGIPQHPAVAAGVARRLGLLGNLIGAEDLSAKGIVGERLQPGPVPHRRVRRPPLTFFEREMDDFVGVLYRIAVAGDAELEARRIEHGRDDVDRRGKVLESLANAGVVLVPADIAEGIHRREHIVGHQALARLAEETGDRRHAAVLVGRIGEGQAAGIGEADVVELDLVEAGRGRLLGDAQGVVPRFRTGGIDPGQALAVLPQAAARGPDRPL